MQTVKWLLKKDCERAQRLSGMKRMLKYVSEFKYIYVFRDISYCLNVNYLDCNLENSDQYNFRFQMFGFCVSLIFPTWQLSLFRVHKKISAPSHHWSLCDTLFGND